MKRKLAESKRTLEKVLDLPCTSFAYPGGRHDEVSRKLVWEAGYSSARASARDRGFNDPHNLKLYALKVQFVTKWVSVSRANNWIDKAMKRGAWLVEVFHTVVERNDKYLWTKEKLESHLSHIKNEKVWVATQGETTRHLLEKRRERERRIHEIHDSEGYVRRLEKHGAGFFRYYLPEVVPPEGGKFLEPATWFAS